MGRAGRAGQQDKGVPLLQILRIDKISHGTPYFIDNINFNFSPTRL
jgi:hypothetical protein